MTAVPYAISAFLSCRGRPISMQDGEIQDTFFMQQHDGILKDIHERPKVKPPLVKLEDCVWVKLTLTLII